MRPARRRSRGGECRGIALVLAAHPDDETIGATSVLAACARSVVVHATDGAPRDPRLWPAGAPAGREEYAALREQEARRALALAGLLPEQIVRLGFVDQEAVEHLTALSLSLRDRLAEIGPRVVIAHPYEGGHPDHDACAFAARAAVALVAARGQRPPVLMEMTSYHARQGALCTGEFLPGGSKGVVRALDAAEQTLKRRMLDCFESQVEVLQPFGVREERFRRAPEYDFTEPPQQQPLHYELLGWPHRARDFCRAAARALEQLGLPAKRAPSASKGPAPCA